MTARCLIKFSINPILRRICEIQTYSNGKRRPFSTCSDQLNRTPSRDFSSKFQHQVTLFHLLQRHGFPQSRIHDYLEKNSFLLNSCSSDVEKCLRILLSFGITQTYLVSLLQSCPQVLELRFLDKWQSFLSKFMPSKMPLPVFLRLLQAYERLEVKDPSNLCKIMHIVNDVAANNETVIRVLINFPRIIAMKPCVLSARIEFLERIGLGESEIDQVLGLFPGVLGLGVEERLKPLLEEFCDLGFCEVEIRAAIVNDPKVLTVELGEFSQCTELVRNLQCRHSIKEKIMRNGPFQAAIDVKMRVDCLCSHGLTRRDAFKVLQREPRTILYELEDVNKKVDLLLCRLGFDIRCLIDDPKFLGVNMEKTIIPRYKVIEYLKSKGGLGRELGLKGLIRPSRLKFYNLYVKPYPECEKIFGKFSRDVVVKPKHPVGLWKLLKPQPFPETQEDLMNIRMFMENLRQAFLDGGSNLLFNIRNSYSKPSDTLDMFEEKENMLQKKILLETERAKEFAKSKNKQAALQCLKRKKFYEGQMEHIGSFQMRPHAEDEKLSGMLAKNCGQEIKADVKRNHRKGNVNICVDCQ